MIRAIGSKAEPLLRESTPPVLSVGRRCMHHGYGFYWPPGKSPYLVTPKGASQANAYLIILLFPTTSMSNVGHVLLVQTMMKNTTTITRG